MQSASCMIFEPEIHEPQSVITTIQKENTKRGLARDACTALTHCIELFSCM